MSWYIETPSHWIRCEVTSNVLGLATVTLYDGRKVTGRARKGLYGWLVEAK